mgnify:CR=1 FL=1
MKILLESGADTNIPNEIRDETALHIISQYGEHELIDLLIKYGANVEEKDLELYRIGANITLSSAYPTGALLQDNSTGAVFYVQDGKLSLQLYQRSADVFLGVPFNIASYALFTMMVAQVCDLEPGDFVHTFGDAHLYSNHMEQAQLQLTREVRNLPLMEINPEVKDIFSFTIDDFSKMEYIC